MKVSIITATSNSESTIKKCLDSLTSQTYLNIELIIIDNKSNDLTLEIIENYRKINKNIQVISESDYGIYDALNKGLKIATGDIIGLLHSDDFFYDTHTIFDIVQLFRDHNYDGVYGDLEYIDRQDTSRVIRLWRSCEFKPHLLKFGWMPPHPTLFLKKEVYKKFGDFNLSYKISSDYDFILRIFKDNILKIFYLPQTITKMRMGGVSNKGLENILKKTKEDYFIIRSNKVGNWLSLVLKNISKVRQFFIK